MTANVPSSGSLLVMVRVPVLGPPPLGRKVTLNSWNALGLTLPGMLATSNSVLLEVMPVIESGAPELLFSMRKVCGLPAVLTEVLGSVTVGLPSAPRVVPAGFLTTMSGTTAVPVTLILKVPSSGSLLLMVMMPLFVPPLEGLKVTRNVSEPFLPPSGARRSAERR